MSKIDGNIFNVEMETISGDALYELHQKRFLNQFQYLYDNAPMYQEKFKASGIQRGDIKGLDDILES